MPEPNRGNHRDADQLRDALLGILASGRAVTTSELRIRAAEAGHTGVHQERIYRQLAALARSGRIARATVPGRSRAAYWTACTSTAPAARPSGSVEAGRPPFGVSEHFSEKAPQG